MIADNPLHRVQGSMNIIGEARSVEELDRLFDRRRIQVGKTMEDLDHAAELTQNYSSKLLMKDKKKAGKRAGPMSFQRICNALGVKLVMVEDNG